MLHAPLIAGEGASPSPIRLRALSLGAGVQSTTIALLAAHGEIGPMPDCAIFADTGWEPRAVYDHLEWLMSGNVLPFPVHADAVEIDRVLRTGLRGIRGEVFLHRSCSNRPICRHRRIAASSIFSAMNARECVGSSFASN